MKGPHAVNSYATTETVQQARDRRHGGTLTPTGQTTHTGTYADKNTNPTSPATGDHGPHQ